MTTPSQRGIWRRFIQSTAGRIDSAMVLAWTLGAEPGQIGLRRAISGRHKIEQWFSHEHAEAKAYV